MVSNNELSQLRADIVRRHRAAGKKVSRLNSQGVDVSGTQYDPRRDLERVKNYNTRQARAYLNQLNSFVSRETQFVQYGNGKVAPAADFQEYKKLERRYNNRVKRNYSKVENTPLPSAYDSKTGKLVRPENTIGRRFGTVVSDKRSKRGAQINAVYEPPNRKAGQIMGPKALAKLKQDMENRLSSGFEDKGIESAKLAFGKMNTVIRDKDLAAMIDALTPGQFAVLWKYTTFATDTAIPYLQAKKMFEGEKPISEDDDFAGSLAIAKDYADWARKLKL